MLEASTIIYFIKVSTRSPHEMKKVSSVLYGNSNYLFSKFDTSLKVFKNNGFRYVYIEMYYKLNSGLSEPIQVQKSEPNYTIKTPYTNEDQPLVILNYRSIDNLKAALTMFGL